MNASLHDLMNTVESIEFDAQMSVFSGFRSFLKTLGEDKTVKELQHRAAQSHDEDTVILNRLTALLEKVADPQYAHPMDVTIAAYLYALSSSKEFSGLASEKVLQIANLMWAKQLAETILANQMIVSQT